MSLILPYFPAGVQYLTAEQALQLARARAYTSDNIRIDNQTLLLQAIFQRLQEPEVFLQMPQLIEGLREIVPHRIFQLSKFRLFCV